MRLEMKGQEEGSCCQGGKEGNSITNETRFDLGLFGEG